ncbi:MAG TPA: adenylyl-sulfate kinase [Thermoleophilaceae bacterium]
MSVLSPSSARFTPLERLERLCEPGSLQRLGPVSDRVGVEAGRGLVHGRPIVCYAQNSTVAGGSVGVAEADVVVRALRLCREEGIPLVAFLESAGARLQEGAAALGGFGRIFSENVALSGHAPQISVITGTSAGGGCYSPALTDFVVMTEEASMFLTGPKIVKQALGEEVSASELGGPQVHERNGVCHFVAADDRQAIHLTRELLGYLPQNASEPVHPIPAEAPSGADPCSALPARARSFYDIRTVLRCLVDSGQFLEVSPRWARNMVVGFARLEGHSIGIIANQSRHLGGVIDVAASQKGAKFVRTCDEFGLPLLVLVDTPGFMPGTRQEGAGIIRHGADLLRAFAATTSPRVTVIVRKAFGGAFITMNSKDLGATASFAWPTAEIGIMSPRGAVEIIHRRRLDSAASAEDEADSLASHYARAHLSPDVALRLSAIDDVVEPAETRERVAGALFSPRQGRRARRPLRASARQGCTVWFTGLSGAGKSTLAALVERELRARGERVEVLDGDVVRRNLSQGLGFSKEDRDTNIRRIAFVADALSRNGVFVLAAAISPYRATREEARQLMGDRFVEVYVEASVDECARRDTKGLYAKAFAGEITEFTGVSDPYEPPPAPEIVVDTETEAPEESAAKVLAFLDSRLHRNGRPGRQGAPWPSSA